MKLIVTEREGLQIQAILLELLQDYNKSIRTGDKDDIQLMVTETGEKIAEVFEEDPTSKWHGKV